MLTDLIIAGAGGTSRELAEVVEAINKVSPRFNLLGFLDDDPVKAGLQVDGYPVLGAMARVKDFPQAQVIIGAANSKNPAVRQQIADRLALPDLRYTTLVDPSAFVSRHTRLGAGSAVLQNVVLSHNTTVGRHVLIGQTASVAHDIILEDYSTIAPGCVVSGFVMVGPAAYLGAGSSLLPRVRIGAGALVGLGAVVMTDVPGGATVVGNPARLMPNLKAG